MNSGNKQQYAGLQLQYLGSFLFMQDSALFCQSKKVVHIGCWVRVSCWRAVDWGCRVKYVTPLMSGPNIFITF